MLIRIEGYDPPASEGTSLCIGIQTLSEVEQVRPIDSAGFTWQVEATVHHDTQGVIDLRGPYVHGRRGIASSTCRGGPATVAGRSRWSAAPS